MKPLEMSVSVRGHIAVRGIVSKSWEPSFGIFWSDICGIPVMHDDFYDTNHRDCWCTDSDCDVAGAVVLAAVVDSGLDVDSVADGEHSSEATKIHPPTNVYWQTGGSSNATSFGRDIYDIVILVSFIHNMLPHLM